MAPVGRLERLALIFGALYVLFIGGSPYYFNVFAVRIFHHVFITVVLSLWLIVRLRRGQGLPSTPLNRPLYAVVILWAMTTLLSLDPRVSAETLWFPLHHLLLFFFFAHLLQIGRQRLLMEVQFLMAALVVVIAFFQLGSYLFGWGIASGTEYGWLSLMGNGFIIPPIPPRLYLPLGVTTWLAAYTAPLILLAIGWALTVRRDFRVVLWALAVGLFIVLILTDSRGGLVAFGAGIGVFTLLRVVRGGWVTRAPKRLLPALAGLGILGAGIAVFVLFLSGTGSRVAGDSLRWGLWRGAARLIQEAPLDGAGPGMFGRGYRIVRGVGFHDDRLSTAHNAILNTGAEVGVIGIILLGVMAGIVLWRWWGRWRGATGGGQIRLEAAFAALVGFAVQSQFDLFQSTPLVLLLALLVALCIVEPRPRGLPPLRGDRIPAVVALILLLVYGVLFFVSDRAQANFGQHLASGGASDALESAIATDPGLRLYSLEREYQIGQIALNDSSPEAREEAIEAYQRALRSEPTWETGWLNLGALYERAQDWVSALEAYARARDLNNFGIGGFHWARVAETQGLGDEAGIRAWYQRTIQSGNTLASFWWETPLRRELIEAYAVDLPITSQYSVWSAHDPSRLPAILENAGEDAGGYWLRGEAARVDGRLNEAYGHYSEAIRLVSTGGEYYASRALVANLAIPEQRSRAQTDIRLASLLGASAERLAFARAAFAPTSDMALSIVLQPFASRVVDQNFEGVLFLGRGASFEIFPELRLYNTSAAVMQPYFDLAAVLEASGDTQNAALIYRLLLERLPDSETARDGVERLIPEMPAS